MVLSICLAILVPVAFYSSSPPFSNHPNINGNVPRPLASAFVDQDPKLYPAEFSPYSSPGYDDEVHLAFTPNQNVTANISITAHPRLLKTGSSGSPRPLCLVPIPEQGVLVMFASRDATDNGLFMARSTDNGSTWSDFATVPGIQTPAIGYPGAFYHNGTIHVIWGDIYNFQYVASTNLGDTWSTPYNFFYDGMIYTGEVYQLEFAVNPATGDFHVVYESLNYNDRRAFKTLNSTDGGNTWSEPVLVPEFNDTMIGVPVEYYKPSLAFRPNGNAIMSGHGASMMMTKVCEYDNGILGAPLATNYLPDDGSTLAIDNSTGKLISLMCPNAEFTTNLRLKEITAISPSLELTTLEDCAWNLPSPMIHTYLSIYNTWIKCANGRVYYYSSDPMRLVGPGIYVLDFPLVVEGMTFENVEEAAIEQQEFHFAWDGLHSGQQVPYVEFLLSLTLTDMFKEVYVYHFTRDDTIPAVEDIAYTPYISPGIPDGVQDQFLANFTTSEYARYRYLIENGERETTDATTFLPDIYEKKNPIFLMDAEFNYYVFYHRIAKGVPEIAMAKSTDLGRTWDEPSPVISGSGVAEFGVTIHNTSIYAIVSNNFGIKNFLRSIDGGKHWETYNHQLTYFNGVHDKFIVETADNGTIFVGGYQNISIFLDGGRTYSHTVHFLAEPNDEIMGLAYDDPRQVLYIAWVDHKEGNAGELYGNITITAWNYSTSTILQARPLVQAWYLHVLGISVNDTTGMVTLVTTTNNASLTNSQGILNYWRSSDLGQSWTAEFIGLCDYAGTIIYSIYKTPTWFVEPCRGVEIFGSSDQATTSAYFLTIQSRLPFLATGTAFVQSNLGGRTAYDGRYSNGTVLHDGNYTFHLITWDRTSGSQEYRLSFEVDNLVPLVSGIMNFPSNPLPRQDVSVSMIAIEKNYKVRGNLLIEFRDKITKQDAEIKVLKESNDNLHKKIDGLESELKKSKEQVINLDKQLKESAETLNAQKSDAASVKTKLESEIATLKGKLEGLDGALKSTTTDKDKQVRDLVEQKEKLLVTISGLEKDKDALITEGNEMKGQITSLKNKVSNMERENRDLTETLKDMDERMQAQDYEYFKKVLKQRAERAANAMQEYKK